MMRSLNTKKPMALAAIGISIVICIENHGTMLEPSIQDCLAFVLNNQSPNHSQ